MKLYNRDGADMQLVQIKDDLWKLTVDSAHEYCLKYMRCGISEDKKYTMIDPSGGPYLEVGDKLNGYKIVEILEPTLLRLCEI